MTLADLDADQRRFDQQHWDHQDKLPVDQVRHTLLHLVRTLGKLATMCERVDHGLEPPKDDLEVVKTEVIPDLIFHAVQLARFLEVDLEAVIRERRRSLEERLSRIKPHP